MDEINYRFLVACENNQVEQARHLIKFADSTTEAFQIACENSMMEIIRVFIDHHRFSSTTRYYYYNQTGYIFSGDTHSYKGFEFYCTDCPDYDYLDSILPINFKTHYRG